MSPHAKVPRLTVTPEDLAQLRAGLWSPASTPEWNLAHRTLDRLEGLAVASMTPDEAKAFMAGIGARLGARAAASTIAQLRERVRVLEASLQGAKA